MTGALRDITEEERTAYRRDGVVKLAGILPAAWVDVLRESIDEIHTRRLRAFLDGHGAKWDLVATGTRGGRYCVFTDKWREEPSLRRICLESPLPKLAGQLFGAAKINFLIDQIFVKEPRADHRTAFHQDESYFNCAGDQCATFWIPVDVIDRTTGAMAYVPGSHLWGRHFKRNLLFSPAPMPGAEGEPVPDIEGHEGLYGVRYIDAMPGDILVHHYRTLHGSAGNNDPVRIRRAAALRYGGDDLRYRLRNPAAMTGAGLRDGSPMDSDDFPVAWSHTQKAPQT